MNITSDAISTPAVLRGHRIESRRARRARTGVLLLAASSLLAAGVGAASAAPASDPAGCSATLAWAASRPGAIAGPSFPAHVASDAYYSHLLQQLPPAPAAGLRRGAQLSSRQDPGRPDPRGHGAWGFRRSSGHDVPPGHGRPVLRPARARMVGLYTVRPSNRGSRGVHHPTNRRSVIVTTA